MPGSTPGSIAELNARFGTQIPGGFEVLKWPVYHYQAYATAGATSYTFFNSIGTDRDVNNMESAASFPAPKKYLLRGICVHFKNGNVPAVVTATPATALLGPNDAYNVAMSGHLEMRVGNKEYQFGAPLGMFPSPVVFTGHSAIDFSYTTAVNNVNAVSFLHNAALARDGYQMDPPIFIESQINFVVELKFTTAQTINTAGTLGVILLGQLVRPLQ